MLLNKDIIDTEKPDGIYSLTFVVDEFSGLFLHLLYYTFKICMINKWCLARFFGIDQILMF